MITHSRPSLEQEDAQAVTRVVLSGQVAQGAYVQRFERGMAAFIGLRGGIAVSSGTAALEMALRVLDVGPGDEVILPSYVCAAPWLATVRVGAQPSLVDIELDSYAMDPDRVRTAISSRTRAIIVPHLFGLPADLTRLQAFGLPVIEDCAQTLGATVGGRPVGTVGAIAVCSFYATKLLCTGEGGMLLSNDATILERARSLRQYDEEPSLHAAAFNYKQTDVQASLGLSQLERIQSFLNRRQTIAAHYDKTLGDLDIIRPVAPEARTHIFYRYVIRVPRLRQQNGAQEDFLERLERRGIQCRRPVFRALHRYLRLDGFPTTDEASETAISIPLYPSLTDEEVERIARTVYEELT